MQNFGLKPDFNMNDIQNKNILMPNFNYNYNFNLGQMKPLDQNKIDLYNTSLTLIDQLQNSYPNNSVTANEIYNIYNMSLQNLKESAKNNKLDDISKKAQFYYHLYNIINQKKCQYLEKEEYKCSFSNTNLPNQPNNKKIQININNNLFNGAILNNGFYTYANKNGLLNNNYNYNNTICGSLGHQFNKNICTLDDNDKDNESTKSKKLNIKEKNEFVGKKRNLDNKTVKEEPNNKQKKRENNLANNEKKNKPNNKNKKNNNNLVKDKNKKKVSPMITIQKDGLKSTNKQKKNMKKNNKNLKGKEEAKFSWSNESEKREEEKFMNFHKDLKDYLRRTISETRQNVFFSNVLPESLDIIKNLHKKDINFQVNKLYPVYRNNKLELSLIIEPGGKIRIQLLNYDI